MKQVIIGNDHAAVAMKQAAVEYLTGRGFGVIDAGCGDQARVDYPDYAQKVAEFVQQHNGAFGVLICGSGIGMSIVANKFDGIRAALCHDAYTAAMARRHNDANVLCFGARIVGLGVMESILEAWIGGSFEGGRHGDRVAKIGQIEAGRS